jgi:2-phospho-L-lactate guanylyltransferase
MDVYIPYDSRNPKTRLSPILTETERLQLSRLMLQDVVETTVATGHTPVVLATEPVNLDVDCVTSTESLSSAVNAALQSTLEQDQPSVDQNTTRSKAVIMADLGIVSKDALSRLFSSESDVIIAPGLKGGTNALVVRSPTFHVDYHNFSYLDHRAIAKEYGLTVSEIDSFRLACDMDRPSDIVELFLHGTGLAAEFITERFELAPERHSLPIRRSTNCSNTPCDTS